MIEMQKISIAAEAACVVSGFPAGTTLKLFATDGSEVDAATVDASGNATLDAHADVTGGRYALLDGDVIVGFGPVEVVSVSVTQAAPDQAAAIAALAARIAALENA